MSGKQQNTDPDWIDPDDAPELGDHFFDNAEVRDGARLVRAATDTMARRGRPPLEASSRRKPVSIRLSPRVLNYFRQTGPGWQSRISEILERHIEGGSKR